MKTLFEVCLAHDGLFWIFTPDGSAYLCDEDDLHQQIVEILANTGSASFQASDTV